MKENKDKTISRVEKHLIKRNNVLWNVIDEYSFKSKNLYNYGNYIIRQIFIITSKLIECKEITKEQEDFLIEINLNLKDYNKQKQQNLLKKQLNGEKLDKEYKETKKFNENNKYIDNYYLKYILKSSEPYKDLGSSLGQQTITLLDQNWKSFFASIKDWRVNPQKYLGIPKLPKYLHKEKGRYIIVAPNQTFEIKNGYINFKLKSFQPLNNTFKTNINPEKQKIMQCRFIQKGKEFSNYVMEIVYEIKKPELINDKSERIISIDLGVNNLATVTNNCGLEPIVINGHPLKSINQFYNKKIADIKSKIKIHNNQDWSKKLQNLTNKRNAKIDDYIHKSTKYITDYCLENNIDTVVCGLNEGWKQNSDIGKKNNQNFINIPHTSFVNKLSYKCENNGIRFISTKESYTSGTSFLDNEEPNEKYYNKSRRIARGLFKSDKGILINADVNGSYQIMKKVFPDSFKQGIENAKLHPVVHNMI